MCLLIYFLWSVILLGHGGQSNLTWDLYGMMSAKLDTIILDQNIMKKEIKDLMTSMTDTNQQVISLEKRLTEVATISQQMVVFQERLDHMDRHVKDISAVEVGRRTHLLRRGLEQEKIAAQSRFENAMNNTRDLSARVEILDNKHDNIKYEVDILASNIHKEFKETGMQISKLEQDMVYNASSLFEMVDSLKKTQSDFKSEIQQASEKTRTQIATVQQEVVTTQRNTQTLQSRDDTFERTLSELKSKTNTIAAQVDTTRGQISRLQHLTGTFVGFLVQLKPGNSIYYNKATVIKFNAVIYNEGSHYNPSTGIFTVPVSGVYVFMFNVEVAYASSDTGRQAHVSLYVNGNYKASALAQGVGFLNGGNAAVLKVWAGDRVYVSTEKHKEQYYIWEGRTSFSGALLHVI